MVLVVPSFLSSQPAEKKLQREQSLTCRQAEGFQFVWLPEDDVVLLASSSIDLQLELGQFASGQGGRSSNEGRK